MTANPCKTCEHPELCGAPDARCSYFDEPDESTGNNYRLRYGRVANLGNFESARVELEEVFPASIPKDVAFGILSQHVEELIATRKKIKLPMVAR